jgi:hypothetical protein
LAKFHENAKIDSIQDRFFRRLLGTKFGAYVNSFNKWKGLPEPKDAGNSFERRLSKIFGKYLKGTFDPLKDINYDAQAIKKLCLRRLLDKAMGQNKRMFMLWATLSKNHNQI